MPAKRIEDSLFGVAYSSRNMTTAGTLYNGGTATGGLGIDTKNFNEIVFNINMGPVVAPGTLTFTVTESATDTAAAGATGSAAITDASFTVVNNANQNTIRKGSIVVRDTLRYVYLKAVKTSATASAIFGADYCLAKAKETPQTNSADFDV